MVLRYLLVVFIAGLFQAPAYALGDVKQALIIGNDAYPESPLKNPGNDARALASTLKKLDFKVDLLINKSAADMKQALDKFARETAQSNAVGLVYFSGHGVQLRDRNLALGVDADMENDLRERSINIQEFLIKMDASNTTNIVIIDACREYLPPNKEFLSNREARNGLQPLDPSSGTLIAFSTLPGRVAFDGGVHEKNGVYAKALLKYLGSPGLPVETIFKNVRRDVAKETNGKQIPMELSLLTRDFYFKPAPPGYSEGNVEKRTAVVDNEVPPDLGGQRSLSPISSLTDIYEVLNKIRERDNQLDQAISKDKSVGQVNLDDAANAILMKMTGQTFSRYELQEMSKNVITVGAYFINTPNYIKDYFRLLNGGVLAKRVNQTGIAYRAGLRDGDILLRVNSNKIDSLKDLQIIADSLHPGESVYATILRNGVQINLSTVVERTSIDDLVYMASGLNAEKKNYQRAIKLLVPLAMRGHPFANGLLANFAWNGLGESIDYQSAFKYAKLASDSGDTQGDFWMSQAYARGNGVPQNFQQANSIRFRAANQQNSWAIAGMGIACLQGQGLAIDYQLAKQYLERAAMQSHHDGILGMAMIFEKGLGVPADTNQAIIWYERAAESGNESVAQIATQKLRMLKGGFAPQPDPVQLIGNVIKMFSK